MQLQALQYCRCWSCRLPDLQLSSCRLACRKAAAVEGRMGYSSSWRDSMECIQKKTVEVSLGVQRWSMKGLSIHAR